MRASLLRFGLDLDLPLPVALDALTIRPRYAELIATLESCEFKGLLAEVKAEAVRTASTPVSAAAQGELFG